MKWEVWEDRSRANMMFFEEPGDAFALLGIHTDAVGFVAELPNIMAGKPMRRDKVIDQAARHVVFEALDGGIRLSVCDDGLGGADPSRGSGLLGLRDRIDALGGRMNVASPPGQGTSIAVYFPETSQ